MADGLSFADELADAIVAEKVSNQGTLSRELEASGRRWVGGVLHDVAAVTGSEGVRDEARRQEDIADLRLRGSALPQSFDDAEGVSGVAGYVGHLAIQSLPYMAEFATGASAAGRAAVRRGLSKTAGRTVGGVAASVPSSTGQILSAQDEQAGQYDLPSAAALAVPHAALSAVAGPERWIASGLPRSALQSRVGRAVSTGAGTAAGEAVTEAAQTTLEQFGRTAVDAEYDILGEAASKERREAAIGGALMGGAFGGGAGAATSRAKPAPEIVEPEAEPAPEVLRLRAPSKTDQLVTPLLEGPKFFADAQGNVSPSPDLDAANREMSLARGEGQGELFRPREVESRAPEAAPAVPAAQEPTPQEPAAAPETPAPAPEQGDLLAGTSAELAAELGSEQARAKSQLDEEFSQAALVRELRVPNGDRSDVYVTKLAANLSRALKEDPEQAVELINDLTQRPNSVRRNNVLRRAAELVQSYEDRQAKIAEDTQAGRTLVVEQYTREMAEAARKQPATPGAEVRLPPEGRGSEEQIRARNQEQALDEGLQDVAPRVEQSRQRGSDTERRGILKRVLEDPETVNPTRRFIAELRRAGFRRGISNDETKIIRRFEEVHAAFDGLDPEQVPAAPNELTPDVTGIRERTEASPEPAAPKQVRAPRSRFAPENFSLESPPSTPEAFAAIDRAQARRERRRAGTQPEPEPVKPDTRQGELFTPTGKPTRVAQGIPPQRRTQRGVGAAFQPSEVKPERPRGTLTLPKVTRDQAPPEPAPAAEDQTPATPAPAPAAAPQLEPGQWTRMIDRALDRERIDMEEAVRLYNLLDEGRVDEVKQALGNATRAQRAEAGATGAAPSATPKVDEKAEKAAREVDALDRSVTRTDKGSFSEAPRGAPRTEKPTSTETLSKLREHFQSPERFDQVVQIHATQQDALEAGALTDEDTLGRGAIRGFAKDGKVHLIAENIETGTELAVFMHELGGHIGFKKLVGARNALWVRDQVKRWAERNDDSVEARVGRWVRQRTQNMSPGIQNEEVVAYAIEGLVREGVTPQSVGQTGNVFRRIWAAAKAALRKLGFKNPNFFTGQNLVDLAFGAADMELRGTWHGTAGNFRSFDHRFMGSGEGHRMFGWGTYLADQRGTAETYRKSESVRKTKRQSSGSLMRVAHTVDETEMLRWDDPISQQSAKVREVLQTMTETAELAQGETVTGEQVYRALSEALGSDKAASQALDAQGVKGVRYLDRGSRGELQAEASHNYVIFNDENLVRASSQAGGDPTKIRFSEAGPDIESARHPAQEMGIEYATTLKDLYKKGKYAVAFGRDLRDMLAKVLPTHRQYFETMAEKQATMMNLAAKVDEIMVDAYAVKGSEREKLNAYLMNSTKAQKWGFKPKWKGAPQVTVDPAMERAFKALSPDAQKIAERAFQHGHDTLQLKNDVVRQAFNDAMAEVDTENLSQTEKRKLKDRIKRQLNLYDDAFSGLKGPYAPLSRFGNYVTVAKSKLYQDTERAAEQGDAEAKSRLNDLRQDANQYAVFFSETAGQAELKKRELDATNKFAHTEQFEKEAYYQGIQDAPWMALLRLKNMVAEEAAGSKEKSKNISYINSLLRDLYLDSLAEASARRHDLQRENIEGANPNMLRSFAQKGKADAHFIAALQHNGKVIEELSQMRSEAAAETTAGGVSKADRKRALNEVLARHAQGLEFSQSPLGGLQDKAMSLTSFYMLATVPRYYVQNLLQVPMISMPTMAGRYGMGASWGALQSAYRDMAKGFGSMRETARGKYDLDALDVTPDERAMLERLRATGLLDVGLQYDLGYWETTAESGPSATVAKVNHFFRTVARQVEVVNRVSTALAAYRLERARHQGAIDPETKTDNAAARMADDIVSQTHGDYSYLNKSRFFRALPKIITQFRTYQMIQLSLLARYTHQAFQGASPEERALGRRTMAYILGQHAVVTGALGLPAVQGVAYALSAVFGDDDEPADGERFLRQIIGDEGLANILLKGVPAAMGLDVSNYIGMGESTSVMPFTDINLTDREGYAETAVGLMGPFVSGVLPNMADGMGQLIKGDYYKGIETMMPSGIRSGMRALRLHNEGQTNRRGDQLLSPDEISTFDTMMQALGFETTKLKELRRKRTDLFEYETYFRDRSSKLKFQYTKAAKARDTARMSELREDWRHLQGARRRVGFKVRPVSDLLRAPVEQRKRERNTRGGLQFDRSNRRFIERLTD